MKLKGGHILVAAGDRAVPGAEAEAGVELSQESLHQLAVSGWQEKSMGYDAVVPGVQSSTVP